MPAFSVAVLRDLPEFYDFFLVECHNRGGHQKIERVAISTRRRPIRLPSHGATICFQVKNRRGISPAGSAARNGGVAIGKWTHGAVGAFKIKQRNGADDTGIYL